MEDDHVVDPVQELRQEVLPQCVLDPAAHLLFIRSFQLQDVLAANVAGHDDDGVFEVDGASVSVGQSTVIEDLQ